MMRLWEEYQGIADRYKDLYGISKSVENNLSMSESLSSKLLSGMAMDKDQIMNTSKSWADEFLKNHDRIDRELSDYKSTSQLIREDYIRLRGLINPAQDLIDRLKSSSAIGVQEAALYWDAGISKTLDHFHGIKIFEHNEPLATRLLQPSVEYASFIESTSNMLNSIGENRIKEKALMASLYISESQFMGINDILSSITHDIEMIHPSPIRPLRVPRIQQKELLDFPEITDVEDEEELIRISPAAGTASAARYVLYMVTGCNEEYQASGKPGIFKTTTRFVEATADLMWLLPDDKRSFADFMDCLYWIFYEGAGKDKLRYLKSNGGVLEPDDCGFIWSIKILRNKWIRHDPEHGSASDLKSSREALFAQFNSLGLKEFPKSPADYRLLHRNLLENAQAFMQRAWERSSESSE